MNYLLQLIIQRLYLLGKLIQVGFDINCLLTIFRAIVVSRVTYALPAWYGQLSQWDIGRLNAIFRSSHKWQLTYNHYIQDPTEQADTLSFDSLDTRRHHVSISSSLQHSYRILTISVNLTIPISSLPSVPLPLRQRSTVDVSFASFDRHVYLYGIDLSSILIFLNTALIVFITVAMYTQKK